MLARLFHNEMEFLSPRYHFKFGVHSTVYSGSDFWTIPIAPRALQAVEKRPSANVVLRAKVFSWLRTEKSRFSPFRTAILFVNRREKLI